MFNIYAFPDFPAKLCTFTNYTRTVQIERGFSAWDGSHTELTRYVKARLRDPKSFEHVETGYSDKGDYLYVRMVYRAKNGFGGMTVNSVEAKCAISGGVLEIISEE